MEQVESHTRRLLGTLPSEEMKSTAFHFQKDDVLYGRLRPYLNKVWRAEFEGLCSSEFIVLPPSESFEPGYLSCFLSTDEFVAFANHLNQGDRPRVSFEQIGEYRIPLPPFAEQRRIVAKLEEPLGKVSSSRQRLSRVPGLLKRFRQSVLAAACSGRLTADWREENDVTETAEALLQRLCDERLAASRRGGKKRTEPTRVDAGQMSDVPESWFWASLDEIVQEGRPIIYGIIKPGPHDPNGVPYVRVVEMKDGQVLPLADLKRASHERASKFTRAILKAGDLLISKDGTIGRVAIVPPELEGGNITQHLVRASIHPFLSREYVAYTIRSQPS